MWLLKFLSRRRCLPNSFDRDVWDGTYGNWPAAQMNSTGAQQLLNSEQRADADEKHRIES